VQAIQKKGQGEWVTEKHDMLGTLEFHQLFCFFSKKIDPTGGENGILQFTYAMLY
jgi:hypothetical protein